MEFGSRPGKLALLVGVLGFAGSVERLWDDGRGFGT